MRAASGNFASKPERAERAEQARAVLNAWNGYAATPAEQDDLDAELDRRLTQATAAK
ncbi:hypothetical protein OH779_40030 [Actinacidiphila glaucinigra]|uniref:hypothetical protein n=1 Tax=Actinacidiphila glaucinigra TaxID=235986 RepID=UPI0038699205